MLLTVALLILSILMITKGADWFVGSSVSISSKSGIPKVIVGATIVSFATTAPEFTVSVMAAYLDHVELTVGNAVGSVLCNIGLVLGSIVAIKAIPLELHGFIRKGAFMLASALVLIAFAYDRVISSFNGLVLLLVFVGFMYYNINAHRFTARTSRQEKKRVPISHLKNDIRLFIAGGLLVITGSRILVHSATGIAQWMGVPEMLIALTIVALGTSLPELITAISSTLKGHQDISIGNILGANVMNIALILGLSSQIRPLAILPQSLAYDLPFMIVLIMLLLLLGITGKKLQRWHGGLILGVYIGYLAGLLNVYL